MVLNKFPLLLYITRRACEISLTLFHLAYKSSFFVERFLLLRRILVLQYIIKLLIINSQNT